jgi:hypothetical protein
VIDRIARNDPELRREERQRAESPRHFLSYGYDSAALTGSPSASSSGG